MTHPISIPLSFLAHAAHGTLYLPSHMEGTKPTISGICIDSRNVRPGDLFVALPGTRVDGHKFVGAAMEAGAICALTSKPMGEGIPHILVDDTAAALGRMAHAYRCSLSPLTVGVTGSVGKTTTKQLMASVLSARFETLYTHGNLNNELGLPLTLLNLSPAHRAAVLEMGMSQIGEIEYLSHVALPDIALITCIGSSHIETLGSREAIARAKLEITSGMREDGVLILNGDEPLLADCGWENSIYVGFAPTGDRYYRITDLVQESGQIHFSLTDQDGGILEDLTVPGIGEHLACDAAMAAVAGLVAGMKVEEIRIGLSRFENTGMRQKMEQHKQIHLIIDCYNAAPESMKAALKVLHHANAERTKPGQRAGRTIAVLGDMRELGPSTDALHQSVGKFCARLGTNALFTFGPHALQIAQGARQSGMPEESIFSFPDLNNPRAIAACLADHARPGDTLLFKASRGTELERVIDLFKTL